MTTVKTSWDTAVNVKFLTKYFNSRELDLARLERRESLLAILFDRLADDGMICKGKSAVKERE